MERFDSVVLEVWREAGRHLAIRESATNIAGLLAKHLPLGYLLIRRFDEIHGALETVAIGQSNGIYPPPLSKTLLTPSHVKRLAAWGRQGAVACLRSGTRDASH